MHSSTDASRLRSAIIALCLALFAAACSDHSTPLGPRPVVSFGKGGPTPGGPNALPERGRIVFQMYNVVNTGQDLFSINEDGSGLKRLTYNAYDDRWPAASRDGKKIAYVATRDATGAADIVVMNADGTLPRTITTSGLYGYMFSRMDWSPDGKRIAVGMNPTGDLVDWNIYLITVATGAMTQVTSFPGEEMFPSWSPDGSRLAFHMADANGVKQIFTMKPDGSDLRQFTFCATDCVEPSWSPDGTTIAHYDPATQRTYMRWVSDWIIGVGFPARYAAWAPDAARVVFLNLDPADYGTLATAAYNGADVKKLVDGYGGMSIATWLRK
jgi:hypothetical protein